VGEYVAAFFEDPCSFVRVFFFDVMQGLTKCHEFLFMDDHNENCTHAIE